MAGVHADWRDREPCPFCENCRVVSVTPKSIRQHITRTCKHRADPPSAICPINGCNRSFSGFTTNTEAYEQHLIYHMFDLPRPAGEPFETEQHAEGPIEPPPNTPDVITMIASPIASSYASPPPADHLGSHASDSNTGSIRAVTPPLSENQEPLPQDFEEITLGENEEIEAIEDHQLEVTLEEQCMAQPIDTIRKEQYLQNIKNITIRRLVESTLQVYNIDKQLHPPTNRHPFARIPNQASHIRILTIILSLDFFS